MAAANVRRQGMGSTEPWRTFRFAASPAGLMLAAGGF
jgi:hypothetical protein